MYIKASPNSIRKINQIIVHCTTEDDCDVSFEFSAAEPKGLHRVNLSYDYAGNKYVNISFPYGGVDLLTKEQEDFLDDVCDVDEEEFMSIIL